MRNPGLFLLPAIVSGLGGVLMLWHMHAWRRVREGNVTGHELAFSEAQYRRRMRASGGIVILGSALVAGLAISPRQSPELFVAVWLAVSLLLLWLTTMAVVDGIASGRHLSRLNAERRVRLRALKAEATRLWEMYEANALAQSDAPGTGTEMLRVDPPQSAT